ncbi:MULTISPECIES: replicative DNA helicase [Bacillus cereus group]|uniref:Replicative DNA helicase n=1 Tax=Bacillus thuringiensis serovar mexicanensis TaxID=180868 RepID=A0A242WAF4_BACTU|nr:MULTISPECIES: replicative DNA helicase [Bacillus cereus group]EEM56656.1 replicative DNA helicase [Bacillus thuringiensis serovar monterrey BGSC 4AJ1]MEB9673238.1 replicative DNA helicase [Bacillus anthracis]OTW50784.1 replicative DNA helicase [Bacillus thuringiensis serovar mexicanensis]OTX09469.1 replicative DNA helicase [Bacillus thuringiensis serovar monterrey]
MSMKLGEMDIPNHIEAEKVVIGSMLLDPDTIEKVLQKLVVNDLYSSNNRIVFECILSLHQENSPIELVSVTTRLQEMNQLGNVSVGYLADLAEGVSSTAGIDYYIDLIKDSAGKRKLHKIGQMLAQESYNYEKDTEELISEAEQLLTDISNQQTKDDRMRSALDIVTSTYENIEIMANHKGDLTGIPTGYTELDRMLSGLNSSDLIIVAARPSVGKTAFGLNIAQNVATIAREPVAIFSLEMESEQLMKRMLCAEGNIDAQALRNGNLSGTDWSKLMMAMGVISNAPLFIDDTPGISVEEIRRKCRKLKREHGLSLILIDYLQLVTLLHSKNGENRQQEVSTISRLLKSLARELKVPVIALSQLSRGVEARQDKRPMMSDIRESGSIEQDADVIAFLYRDDYYNADTENKNTIEVILAKQRNGPVGVVELAFLKEYNKFVNLERRFS